MNLQLNRSHLNYHTVGFRPQTQKSEPPYKTPHYGMGVKS